MSLWRKLQYLVSPGARQAEDTDIQRELDALRQFSQPGELGNLTLAAEDARGVMSWLWLERLMQDLRYALRSMRHHKAFTALVVTSLALGIGANTAIFSFMDAILLRPLPVRDPHSLVVMKWRARSYALATSGMTWSTRGSSFDEATGTFSSIFPYPALQIFEEADDVLASAFCYVSETRLGLTIHDQTDSIKGQHVSGGYFTGMGVTPVAGRLIQPADDDPATAAVAVLSERMTRRRFGEPAAAIGQTIRLNDKPFTVIGVMSSEFFGAEPGAIPDVFVPMRADSILQTAGAARKYTDTHYYWIEVVARLKPGVSLEQAQAALAPRFRQFVNSTATTDAQRQDLPALAVQPGATGLDNLRRQYAQPIYILMAMVGLILLIACSNIAHLLLSRASARRREIAVRLSIGASRGRVVRQLLTESVLLASIGGALGIAVAWWGIGVLTQLLSNGRDHFTLHAELNWTALAVTLALSVTTGLVFGLAPARQATRVDVVPALKDVRIGAAPRRRFGLSLSRGLIVVQIVFSLVLLVGAGLFGRTLSNLHGIPTGFDRDNVLLFTIRPFAVGYQGPALPQLYEGVRERLAVLPGVRDASFSTAPLPMGGGTMAPVGIAGAQPVKPAANGRPPTVVLASVGPGFFRTLRMPVLGREFTSGDTATAPKVVVINRLMARTFGVESPLGQMATLSGEQFEIVGVVDDALSFTLKEERRPSAYFPALQAERPSGQMTFEIRTAGNPLLLASAVRETVRRIDPRIAIHDVKSQAAHIDQGISTEITLARLCAVFAALALVMACVGLYGTVAFNVSRRTNEIGIRMTLGAARLRIIWMVLREVVIMMAAGLALGVPLAFIGSRYVGSLLYGVEPGDPVAIGIGVAALLACGVVAGLIPARRASRIDPMVAIRTE